MGKVEFGKKHQMGKVGSVDCAAGKSERHISQNNWDLGIWSMTCCMVTNAPGPPSVRISCNRTLV